MCDANAEQKTNNLKPFPITCRFTPFQMRKGFEIVHVLFFIHFAKIQNYPRPVAIFCGNNLICIGIRWHRFVCCIVRAFFCVHWVFCVLAVVVLLFFAVLALVLSLVTIVVSGVATYSVWLKWFYINSSYFLLHQFNHFEWKIHWLCSSTFNAPFHLNIERIFLSFSSHSSHVCEH